MKTLLHAEFYQLTHSKAFWGLMAAVLVLSSLLLLDSTSKTQTLFLASLYNTPLLSFFAMVFTALFVGGSFENRTITLAVTAGQGRGKILLAQMLVCQLACCMLLALPLAVHGAVGQLVLHTGPGLTAFGWAALVLAMPAMCMLPFFLAVLCRDVGRTLAGCLVVFLAAILLLNQDYTRQLAQLLPMGQLRLLALQQATGAEALFWAVDAGWTLLLGLGSYGLFRKAELK